MKLKLFTIIFLLSLFGYSQVTTSKIQGNVTDGDGPLFGATVVAKHLPTGTVAGTTTQDNGNYLLSNLRVGGPYTVSVSYVGYKTVEYTDIYLELGKATDIDAVLKPESEVLEEIVIKTSKDNTFNSNKTGSETNVGKRELNQLPTISRSAADFTRLDPSASGGSFGGRNDQFNNFSLNGAMFNNPFGLDAATPGGQTDSQPISLDAIDQIQVSIAPYDVTLSGFTGASVNAVTKSGTNEFKGTVYTFMRNEKLTGDKIMGQSIITPKLNQTQAGFAFGGPIIKNKLFFFVNAELDDKQDLGTNGFIPNNGDATVAINEANVLESDMIKVKNALAQLGYDTGAYKDFTFDSKSKKGIFKLDWNISEKHRFAIIYNFLQASKGKPAHPTAIRFRGPSASILQFENSGYEINNNLNSFLVELNSSFADNISNKFQAVYTHFDDFRNPFSTPAPVININKNGSSYIVAGYEPFSIHNTLDQRVIQITDNVNITKGAHAFTLGASFEKFTFDNSFNLGGLDRFGAPPYYGTFNIPGYGGGDAGAYASVQSFLDDLYLPDMTTIDTNSSTYLNYQAAIQTFNDKNAKGVDVEGGWKLAELNVGQLASYLQDEWSISNDFKLTLGLRADKPMYFDTADMIQKFMDKKFGVRDNSVLYFNPQTKKGQQLISTVLPNDNILLSPRVGFNYDLNKNVTQLRGGTGIFTGRLPFVWLGNQVSGADDVFFQIVDPNFKWPQVWRSSLGFDHKLKNGFTFIIDANYTKDRNSAHVQNWGLKDPSTNLVGADNRPFYTVNDKVLVGGNPANAYVFTNSDKGYTFNTSIKVQKTFDSGLFTSIAYNYLDAKDVNSIEAEITGDAFAFNPTKGNANLDELSYSKYGNTHRVVGVIAKNFKYGSNNKWSTNVSTVYEYARGNRFNYTYAGDANNDGVRGNDLIFVPTTAQLASMNFASQAERDAYNNFIEQDEYLSSIRGQISERYGALAPWRGRWDVKLIQSYDINFGKNKTNSIEFTADILNFGNLLSSKWGVVQSPITVQPIEITVDNTTQIPTYKFDSTLKKTYSYENGLDSRWQAQFGVRYIF